MPVFFNINTKHLITKRFIGVYNYFKEDLPFTKMVAFDEDVNVVTQALVEHSEENQKSFECYHVAEYESDWNEKAPNMVSPVKVGHYKLSEYAF